MRIPLLAALAALVMGVPANASHCFDYEEIAACSPPNCLQVTQVTAGTPEGTLYLDDRSMLYEGTWLYQESNGIWSPKAAGVYNYYMWDDRDLQRGGCADAGPASYCDPYWTCPFDPEWVPDRLLL